MWWWEGEGIWEYADTAERPILLISTNTGCQMMTSEVMMMIGMIMVIVNIKVPSLFSWHTNVAIKWDGISACVCIFSQKASEYFMSRKSSTLSIKGNLHFWPPDRFFPFSSHLRLMENRPVFLMCKRLHDVVFKVCQHSSWVVFICVRCFLQLNWNDRFVDGVTLSRWQGDIGQTEKIPTLLIAS